MSRTAIFSQRLFYIGIVIVLISCSKGLFPDKPLPVANERAKVAPDSPPSLEQAQHQKSIRGVDFSNFTYPWTEDLLDPDKPLQKTFSLTNGELLATRDQSGFIDEMGVDMCGVYYGDATGDNAEDAIVVLSIQTGGSALPNIVYVYEWQDSGPTLLWAFSTGDRADEGLRNVYTEKGALIVELYSHRHKQGDCCPRYYTRTRYEWVGKRFHRKGKREILPNTDNNASLRFHPN